MKPDKFSINDICEQSEFIITLTAAITKDDVIENMLYQNALIRSVEIIGEAAKRLSEEFRTQHPEIPLSEMARTRDKMIHGYDQIDFDLLWHIITIDIPEMYHQMSRLK